VLAPAIRAGAHLGQFVRPEVWRRASVPLVARLQTGDGPRPRLSPEQRERLVRHFADDVDLLSELSGQDFSDWLSPEPKGSFEERRRA
jgi:hypothetical protein